MTLQQLYDLAAAAIASTRDPAKVQVSIVGGCWAGTYKYEVDGGGLDGNVFELRSSELDDHFSSAAERAMGDDL